MNNGLTEEDIFIINHNEGQDIEDTTAIIINVYDKGNRNTCTKESDDEAQLIKQQILNNQMIVDKLKERLLYYQNRGWETEGMFRKELESIYFVTKNTVHSNCTEEES